MTTPAKGIDVRQTGTALLFRYSLKTAAGTKLTTGTTELQLARLTVQGITVVVEGFDFADNTFKTTLRAQPTLELDQQQLDGGAYDLGVWTGTLTELDAFAPGDIILTQVTNPGAYPVNQEREFQYGSEQGDLITFPDGTGQAWLATLTAGYTGSADPAQKILAAVIESGFSFLKVMQILGGAVASLSSNGPGGFQVKSLSQDRNVITGTSDEAGNRLTASYP